MPIVMDGVKFNIFTNNLIQNFNFNFKPNIPITLSLVSNNNNIPSVEYDSSQLQSSSINNDYFIKELNLHDSITK